MSGTIVVPEMVEDHVTAPPSARPAIDGWFTPGPDTSLLGQSCTSCGTTVFPPTATTCPNPACRGDELTTRALARTGTVWSWAVNHYEPPPPYIAPDPFVPYTVLAVELDGEGLVVLGQLAGACDPSALHVGMGVEVVAETLYEDEDGHASIWKFRPTGQEPA